MKKYLIVTFLFLSFCATGCTAAQIALDALGVYVTADPTELHFKATVGRAKPDAQNVRVSCTSHDSTVGDTDCNFNVSIKNNSSDKNWLSVTPTSSTGSDRLIVTVDNTNLTAGTYTATIHIESDAFMQVDESKDVAVNLVVSAQ